MIKALLINWKVHKSTKHVLLELLVRATSARWIVSEDKESTGELGFRIFGINFWYYKWSDPMFASYKWRTMNKREFGEVIKRKGKLIG